MTKHLKRLLSIVLVCILAFGTAMPAFAASTVTITMYANYPDGTGTTAKAATQNTGLVARKTLNALAESVGIKIELDGYTLTGWNTKKDGSGTAYACDAMPTSKLTVYAMWEEGGCTITYDDGTYGQGSFGTLVLHAAEGDKTPMPQDDPTYLDYTFMGWSPEVSEYVTGDAEYVALWDEEIPKPQTSKPASFSETDIKSMTIGVYCSDVLNANNENPSVSIKTAAGTSSSYPIDIDYTMGEILGNDIDGYTLDITFNFKSGDAFEERARETMKKYPNSFGENQGDWVYDFTRCEPSQVLHLYYVKNTLTNKWTWYSKTVDDGSLVNITAYISQIIKVYMTCPAPEYTVTYTDGADGEAFEDQVYTVSEGDETPAFSGEPTREGYDFAGWEPQVASTVTQDVVYTAQWTPKTYTVTFVDEEGNTLEEVTVSYGETVSELPEVPEKENYVGSWGYNGEAITEDTVIKPVYERYAEYIVSVDCDCKDKGANSCTSWVCVYVNGTKAAHVSKINGKVSVFAKPGDEVKLEAVAYDAVSSSNFAGPESYVIKWIINGEDIEVEEGTQKATLDYVAKADTVTDITGVISLEEKYKLIFDVNDSADETGSFKKTSTKSIFYYYYPGDVITINDNSHNQLNVYRKALEEDKRYVLTGWNTKKDGTGDAYTLDENETLTLGNEEVTLYAHWEKVDNLKYTFVLGEGGKAIEYTYRKGGVGTIENLSTEDSFDAYVSNYEGSFRAGVYKNITAVAEEGYTFDGWYINGEKVAEDISSLSATDISKLFPAISEDTVVEARFICHYATLTVSVDCDCKEKGCKSCVSWIEIYINDSEEEIAHISAAESPFTISVKPGDKVTLRAVAYDRIGMSSNGGPITLVKKWIVNGEEVAASGTSRDVVEFVAEEDAKLDYTAVIELEEKYKLNFNVNASLDEMGQFRGVTASYNATVWYYYYPDDVININDNSLYQNTATRNTVEEDKRYELVGWNTEPDGSGTAYTLDASEFVTMGNEEMTLYAQWEKKDAFKYTFKLTQGGEAINYTYRKGGVGATENLSTEDSFDAYVSNYDGSFRAGVYKNITAVAKAGYTFDGWYINGEKVAEDISSLSVAQIRKIFTAISEDVVVEARFTNNTYTVSFDSDGAGEVEAVTVYFDKAFGELPTVEKTGYTFDGWYDADGNKVTAETVYTVAGDSTLTAKWSLIDYTLSFDTNGAGKVDTVTVHYNEAVGKLPVVEKAGYTFDGWFDKDGKEVTAETVYALAADSTLTAKWTGNTYKINFNANGGTVKPLSKEVTFGSKVGQLPVPVRQCYAFAGWTDSEGNKFTADTVYSKVNDTALIAEWTESHSYKTYAEPASETENGLLTVKCEACGAVKSTAVIYKASNISISADRFVYNGKAQKPTVAVKDEKGNAISGSYYTVTYSAGTTNVGEYKVTVKFSGNYTGSKTFKYVIAPAAPTGLKASKHASHGITISWNKSEGAAKYIVYKTIHGKKWLKCGETTSTSLRCQFKESGTRYMIKVVAVDKSGKIRSDASKYLVTSTRCAQPQIELKHISGSKAKVKWEKVVGADSYTVYYSTQKNGKYTKLATVKGTSYTSKKLVSGKLYFFKVVANRTMDGVSYNSSASSSRKIRIK